MNGRVIAYRTVAVSTMWAVIALTSLCLAATSDEPKSSSPAPQPAAFAGTWSGTLFSKRSSAPPFSMTIVLTPDSKGGLTASASHNSNCIREVHLEVALTGSQLTLAGTDQDGDSMTVRGTIDRTGTMLNTEYIVNGSASGRCESDTGTGKLAKR